MKDSKLSPKSTRVVIFVLFYLIYSYLILAYLWRNNLMIPINELTTSNLAQEFTTTFFAMLLIPIIIFIFKGKELPLFKINFSSSGLILILSLLLIFQFFMKGDFSSVGLYKLFNYLIFVAFAEEFIFRGFIYSTLSSENKRFAKIVSGLSWGFIHGYLGSIINGSGILQMIFLCVCYSLGFGLFGLYFIYIYEKSGSLFVPILIHALLDYSSGLSGIVGASGFIAAIGTGLYLYIRSKKENKARTI